MILANFTRKKVLSFILLTLIFSLAFFIRVYFCYDKVLSDPVKYAADDGVYHMRLVENELLGKHFPHRIYFDPYTYFPYGSYVFMAPLYDQLLAGIIWLVAFGHPTLELINKIAPFYPVALGSLIVFVIYFISKSLWGNKTAIFSAFLMAISQPFLVRSLLGSTDHHVAEVLFSSLAVMFLILALKARNQKNSNKEDNNFDIKKDIKENRKFYLFTLLVGFCMGFYFLTWNGAILFLTIISIFTVLYYLLEYFSGNNSQWVLLMGMAIFLIPLVMITPLLWHPDPLHSLMYNIHHLECFGFGLAGLLFVWFSGIIFLKKGIKPKYFLLYLILTILAFVLFLKFIFPSIYKDFIEITRMANVGLVPNRLARELVSENAPVSIRALIESFGALFYLSLFALIIILFKFIKEKKPEHLLIIVWTVVIILMTGIFQFIGQGRIAAYLSFNVSFLSGFMIVKGFEFGWRGLKRAEEIPSHSTAQPYLLVGSIFIIFNVIFFLFYPFPFNIGYPFPTNLPAIFSAPYLIAKSGPPMQSNDWYDVMEWLRKNTPDPKIDYYSLYNEPLVDKVSGKILPYNYPPEAYGVLATWDVGHMITYYAHRIPNANNFQQGVGKKVGDKIEEIGETNFFLENEEENALGYLDQMKTRYIITTYPDAEGIFRYKVKWLQGNMQGYDENSAPSIGPSKYDNSMMVRLHLFDGGSETISQILNGGKKEFLIKTLDHFRLVYESANTVSLYKKDPKKEVKEIKIFEYVKGAKIVGFVKAGIKVHLSTEISTNQNRKFIYQKDFQAEGGRFEFTVPYSTLGEKGRVEGETKFDVFAAPYVININNKQFEVNVSEKDILEGRTINLNIN